MTTKGNDDCHVILRGAKDTTNYDVESIAAAAQALAELQLNSRIMIDCSHGNSGKDYRKQAKVAGSIAEQVASGSELICGVIEIHASVIL